MKYPNIFFYANSKLAQDAFICYLLEWSDPKYQATGDEFLHKTAQKFVKSLFAKHDVELSKINSVEVLKQDNHIDIGAIIDCDSGQKCYLLIEDKTNTKNHSHQLWRYYNDVLKRSKTLDVVDIIPIYLKTHDQSKFDLDIFRPKHEEEKYHPPEVSHSTLRHQFKAFMRDDFLSVLESYQGQNELIIQFRENLTEIENAVNSFSQRKIEDWKRLQFIGFYKKLQKELNIGYWKDVNNKAGGFCAYIFPKMEHGVYTQLEGKNGELSFCFKIHEPDTTRQKKVRNEWSLRLINHFKLEAGIEVTKPKSFGKGKFMTVAVVASQFPLKTSTGCIDIEQTLLLIQTINKILKGCPAIEI